MQLDHSYNLVIDNCELINIDFTDVYVSNSSKIHMQFYSYMTQRVLDLLVAL